MSTRDNKTNLDFIQQHKPELIEMAHLVMTSDPNTVPDLINLMDDKRIAIMLMCVQTYMNIVPLIHGMLTTEAVERGLTNDRLMDLIEESVE